MDSHARLHLYQLAEFLSHMLGPSYHFAYYDAEDIALRRATFAVGEESLQQSISCTELVRRVSMEDLDANVYYQLNPEQDEATGFRNNLFFFKHEDGSLAGVFVVSDNFGAKMKLMAEIESMFNVKIETAMAAVSSESSDMVPVSTSSLPRLVRQLLDELKIETSGNLTPAQKVALIHKLRERGAFKLKGAVPIIAQLLNTSIPTVYRYLSKLDQNGNFAGEISAESIRLL